MWTHTKQYRWTPVCQRVIADSRPRVVPLHVLYRGIGSGIASEMTRHYPAGTCTYGAGGANYGRLKGNIRMAEIC